jgi:hypothetical protein
MIQPKTIILTHPDQTDSNEAASYSQADAIIRACAETVPDGERLSMRTVVVFEDHFVWASSISVDRSDTTSKDFVQAMIQADWEFNAGVRPTWWPHSYEADRMWGVHYREDRDNGRAELARMRLDRYDLTPLALTPLPLRNAPEHER